MTALYNLYKMVEKMAYSFIDKIPRSIYFNEYLSIDHN